MDEKFLIEIAGRRYPITIRRDEEEIMRAAARQIDKKLLQYQSKYDSVYTTRDWLALIALQLSADNLRMEEKQDTSPFEKKIRELTDELDRYLKDK
jgi:cell division protein ZapA